MKNKTELNINLRILLNNLSKTKYKIKKKKFHKFLFVEIG